MGYRVEVWDRPGATGFGHRDTIDWLRATMTRRGSGLGEGGVDVAANLDATRLNRIVFGDKDAPANNVTALIRMYRDGDLSGVDVPYFEWLADARIPPATVEQPDVKASGLDINSLFGWGTVEAWDWDGSADWQSFFPDWIWGGRNLLGTLEGRYLPEVVTLSITATAGTVTVTVTNDAGSDTTAGVAFNGSALDWKIAIQALSNVTLVDVDGDAGGPFRLTFTDSNSNTIVGSSAGANVTVVQQGRILPTGYEESRSYVSDLPHGFLVEWRMWETGDPALPAGCSTAVMFNGTEPDYPGFQKVVRVKPGGVYQIRSKITANNAGDTVRMVVRDMAENEINGAGNARDEQSIAVAGTWQDFEIANLVIPRDVSEVIVRWGHVDVPGVDPGRIFVACPEFIEGLAATTIGAILEALYDDAQTDHAGDGREVWGSGPFLELDFDAVNDSGGAAWAEAEVSVRFNLNTNYSLVLAEITNRGYEWRIVPKQTVTANPADDGVWLLQVFNPNTAGTDYSLLDDPAILPGTDIVARAGRMFAPSATSVRVQGADGYTSRSTSAAGVTALGRREAGIQSADLFSLDDTAAVAGSELADRLSRAESISPTLRPTPGRDPVPGTDFDVFDTLNVADVPYVSKADRRCAAWTATVTPDIPEGEFLLSFTAESFVGQAAVNAGVRRLLREFDAIRKAPDEQPDEMIMSLGGGKIPWLVAASGADDRWKEVAGWICDGAADEVEIELALAVYREVWLTPGVFTVDVQDGGNAIFVDSGKVLRGLGDGAAFIEDSGLITPASQSWIIENRGSLIGMSILSDWSANVGCALTQFSIGSIRGVYFEQGTGGTALRVHRSSSMDIEDCYFDASAESTAEASTCLHISRSQSINVTGCNFTSGTEGIILRDLPTGGLTNGLIDINACTIQQQMYDGVIFDGPQWSAVHDCVFFGNCRNVGTFAAATPYADVRIVDTNDFNIHDCRMEPANGQNPAISVVDSSDGFITGCRVEDQQVHAFFLDGASSVQVHHNLIPQDAGLTATDTWDYIHVTGASDQVFVESNQLGTQGAGDSRYGVNWADATITCSKCVANTIGPTATDPIGITGGAEVELSYPNDATWGDNWTDCGSPSSP